MGCNISIFKKTAKRQSSIRSARSSTKGTEKEEEKRGSKRQSGSVSSNKRLSRSSVGRRTSSITPQQPLSPSSPAGRNSLANPVASPDVEPQPSSQRITADLKSNKRVSVDNGSTAGYDTIIRDGGKVIARLRLAKLKILPSQWNTRYEANGVKVYDKNILHNSCHPLQIYVNEYTLINVHCEFPDASRHSFMVRPTDLIESLKQQVAEAFGFQQDEQIFMFGKQILQSGVRFAEKGIKDSSVLKIFVEKPGSRNISVKTGSGLVVKFKVKPTDFIYDLKLRFSDEQGTPPEAQKILLGGQELKDLWTFSDYQLGNNSMLYMIVRPCRLNSLGFSRTSRPGLNIYGICPNSLCKSNEEFGEVVQSLGYVFVKITQNKIKFPCPICHPFSCYYEDTKYMFTPTRFMVSVGRAYFRYRRMGSNKTNSRTLESKDPGGISTTFNSQALNLGQDLMEIRCVKPEESFHSCVKCDQKIDKKENESLMTCGHVFHKSCLESSCTVCRAPDFSKDDLVSWCDNNSCLPMSLLLSSYISVSSSTQSLEGSRLVNPATFDLQKTTQLEPGNLFSVEWLDKKNRHVSNKLASLLITTNVNSFLLSSLHASGTLEQGDLDELNSVKNQEEKCLKFYEMILMRAGAFDSLICALQETKQMEALHLLMQVYESESNPKSSS